MSSFKSRAGSGLGLPMMSCGPFANRATGSKSFSTSYWSWLDRPVENMRPPVTDGDRIAVRRGADAALMPASVPDAPVTFSITIVCPSVDCMWAPRMRAITSVGPPAANGTISVIGRAG